MAYTNLGLVEFCKRIVNEGNWVYLMGTIGQNLSQSLLDSLKKRNPHNWYTASKISVIQKAISSGNRYKCVDCVGMIKCYYWGEYGTGNASGYKAEQDLSADTMWSRAKEKGYIVAGIPEIPGIAVWMSGHIGVYIGNNMVVESTPNTRFSTGRYQLGGPCITKLNDRKWTGWLKIPYIEYVNNKENEVQAPPIVSGGNIVGKPIKLNDGTDMPCLQFGTWKKCEDGIRWWYTINDKNDYVADSWLQDPTSNLWYHFDENGYMQTGWIQDKEDGKWYYLDPDGDFIGHMVVGFIKSPTSDKVYYMKPNGSMADDEYITIYVPKGGTIM